MNEKESTHGQSPVERSYCVMEGKALGGAIGLNGRMHDPAEEHVDGKVKLNPDTSKQEVETRDTAKPLSRDSSEINSKPGPQITTSTTIDDTTSSSDLEATLTKSSSATPLYTSFTPSQKWVIVGISAYGGFISPLSGSIYLPALNTLASQFHVTPSQINLTITTYMVFQGITPMFIGNLADSVGYRPAFILCFVIYLIANIALACQNSYAALMVLRCFQSMGSSGTVALRNGVIASVVTPAQRGTALGLISLGTLCAPAFGPLIGGALTATLGWRWVFWFLTILSATCLISQILFVPETNRKIVGNGSVPPYEWWSRSPFDKRRGKKISKEEYMSEREAANLPPRKKIGWPNPWPSLVLFGEKDTAIVLVCIAVNFAALYDVMTSVPVLYSKIYGLDTVDLSLCYIAIGIGAATASMSNGRIQDWNWRRVGRKHGIAIDRKRGQDLRQFPIEEARIQVALPMFAVGTCSLIAYGWVLEYQCPLPVTLILAFFSAMGVCGGFQGLVNLLIDMYPEKPSAATAASNISRCLLGAAATASVQPMIEGMGVGWCFTLMGLIVGMGIPVLLLEMRLGPRWREERWVREERKREEGEKTRGEHKAHDEK